MLQNQEIWNMGTSQTANWKPPTDLYIIMDYKYCKVWVRKSDKVEHLEQYKLMINSQQQLKLYQDMFALRLEQQYFPSTIYFINESSLSLCSGFKQGSILIERIPYRLCNFSNISYNESISILLTCLKGYQILYQRYGMFKIKSTMIGFDKNYKIKIWHHTDLVSPYPQDPYCSSLVQMIKSLIKCIQNISNYPYNIHRFSEYLQIKKISLFSFELTLKMLQNYTAQNNFKIKSNFDHIEKYIKQTEGLLSIQPKSNLFKSPQKSQISKRNGSAGKYSFKNHKMMVSKQNQSNQSSISYNLNISSGISRKSDLKQAKSNEKDKQFNFRKLQKQQSELLLKSKQDKMKISDSKYFSYLGFDDYGIRKQNFKENSKIKKIPHNMLASNNQNMLVSPKISKHSFDSMIISQNNQKQSVTSKPKTHIRIHSDLTQVSKPFTNNKVSLDRASTKSGQRSSKMSSLKSVELIQSYSMLNDSEIRNDLINMMRSKQKQKPRNVL